MSAAQEQQPDHKRIVASLAEESQVPVEDVVELYEHEYAELAIGAHITKFLHIFAIRNVQEILRRRGIDRLAKRAAGGPRPAAERLLTPLRLTWATAPAVAEKEPQP